VLTAASGTALALVAARYRLLDSAAGVVALGALVVVLIGLGVRAMMQPWDDWDE
jgi:hypothetical protein